MLIWLFVVLTVIFAILYWTSAFRYFAWGTPQVKTIEDLYRKVRG